MSNVTVISIERITNNGYSGIAWRYKERIGLVNVDSRYCCVNRINKLRVAHSDRYRCG
jgi:hypothetical protein